MGAARTSVDIRVGGRRRRRSCPLLAAICDDLLSDIAVAGIWQRSASAFVLALSQPAQTPNMQARATAMPLTWVHPSASTIGGRKAGTSAPEPGQLSGPSA